MRVAKRWSITKEHSATQKVAIPPLLKQLLGSLRSGMGEDKEQKILQDAALLQILQDRFAHFSKQKLILPFCLFIKPIKRAYLPAGVSCMPGIQQ